jgi:hypothetical protein
VQGRSPATWHGNIWGVYADWAYYRLGIFAWIFELGIRPGAQEMFPSNGRDIDVLHWSDQNYGGKLFVDWKPYKHPQLGDVEIGGFVDNVHDPRFKTYTNIMTLPGPNYDRLLANHTKWHLFLSSQSPLVKILEAKATPKDSGYYTITTTVRNEGVLPTYITKQALNAQLARTTKASIALTGATLVAGPEKLDLGHLEGNQSAAGSVTKVEWIVKITGTKATAVVKTVSDKGGTDSKTIHLVTGRNRQSGT